MDASPSRVRSTEARDYPRVARPFAAMAKNFADGFEIEPHSHPRHQFIYAVSGLMRIGLTRYRDGDFTLAAGTCTRTHR